MKPTVTQSRKPAAARSIASRKHQSGYLDFPNAAGSDLVVLTRMHVYFVVNKFRMARTRRGVTSTQVDSNIVWNVE